jgi:butyrate kinase
MMTIKKGSSGTDIAVFDPEKVHFFEIFSNKRA